MKKLIAFIRSKPLTVLIVAVPLAIIAEFGHWDPVWVFTFSALGVVPMADAIGDATESLAVRTGPRISGLLNATLGNAAELIITIIAIREGLLELVLASITGSILGNLLLVMGLSMVLGGIRHGTQTFDRMNATRNAILLVLSVVALLIPSILSHYIGPVDSPRVEAFSLGVATVMIVLYVLALFYSFRSHGPPLSHHPVSETALHGPSWSVRKAMITLAVATGFVVLMSEILVGAVEPVVSDWGISEFFLGIIIVPIIGNVAEHLVAVEVAVRNQMDLSVEIAVASSLQIALFVAPVLVFISLFFGNHLHLVFNQFELLALIAGVLITALVSADGESNWLEGAELLALYIILGMAFFLLPA